MKRFFIILVLHMISGPGCDCDVIGYSGGSILILSDLQWDTNRTRSVCRVEKGGCVNLMTDQTRSSSVSEGRLRMYSNADGRFLFLIRHLTPQDSGFYRFTVGEEKSADIQLSVITDASFGRKERKTVFLGDTFTMSCNYPPEFTVSRKRLISFKDLINFTPLIYTEKDSQKEQYGRFSIFDDRRSKVFRVELSDVRKEDGVVYSCGAKKKIKFVTYYSYFREFQLQVTGVSGLVVYSSVGAVFFLFAVALITAIYCKIKCKASETMIRTSRETKDKKANDSASIPLQSRENTNQSDSVYESLTPSTNQSDSVYESLMPNTNQSDSVY
ncbi:polymeric immunoglobulin receptor-like [Hoplias malabaricus]|uniref:polymeric immunoglobulin receptor-like n=1 Tax=Hoplias malabaricus TaxID=27720 RepID=UPI003462D837